MGIDYMHVLGGVFICLILWGMCSLLYYMFLQDFPEPRIESYRVRVALIVLGPVSLVAMALCQITMQFYDWNRDWIKHLCKQECTEET